MVYYLLELNLLHILNKSLTENRINDHFTLNSWLNSIIDSIACYI